MYDRRSSQLADCVGEGTVFGQRVGAPKSETYQAHPGVHRVPPPSGTPSTGATECGKWLIVSDFGLAKVFYHPIEAQQAFRLLGMHMHCCLAYVLEETTE